MFVEDMQEDIGVNDFSITGTLKYVDGTGWDAGTWPEAEASGNFLALKVDADEGAEVTVELVGGEHGPVTLDEDMNVVIRVTNNNQKVKVVSTVDGESTTKVFNLYRLKLEAEA